MKSSDVFVDYLLILSNAKKMKSEYRSDETSQDEIGYSKDEQYCVGILSQRDCNSLEQQDK